MVFGGRYDDRERVVRVFDKKRLVENIGDEGERSTTHVVP
jgi:hypothetical protein